MIFRSGRFFEQAGPGRVGVNFSSEAGRCDAPTRKADASSAAYSCSSLFSRTTRWCSKTGGPKIRRGSASPAAAPDQEKPRMAPRSLLGEIHRAVEAFRAPARGPPARFGQARLPAAARASGQDTVRATADAGHAARFSSGTADAIRRSEKVVAIARSAGKVLTPRRRVFELEGENFFFSFSTQGGGGGGAAGRFFPKRGTQKKLQSP